MKKRSVEEREDRMKEGMVVGSANGRIEDRKG